MTKINKSQLDEKPACLSSFDVAWWFLDMARVHHSAMPAFKLHTMLYLAQGSYGALHNRRRLMPAFFTIYNGLPVEVALHRLMQTDQWKWHQWQIAPETVHFLERILVKYDGLQMDYLRRKISRQSIIIKYAQMGDGILISHDELMDYFMEPDKPQLITTNDGRLVESWMPTILKKLPTAR